MLLFKWRFLLLITKFRNRKTYAYRVYSYTYTYSYIQFQLLLKVYRTVILTPYKQKDSVKFDMKKLDKSTQKKLFE